MDEDLDADETDEESDDETGEARQAENAAAVRLGRFLPLGMIVGAALGIAAGAVTQRFGICIPVGIALGILTAGIVPVLLHRR